MYFQYAFKLNPSQLGTEKCFC